MLPGGKDMYGWLAWRASAVLKVVNDVDRMALLWGLESYDDTTTIRNYCTEETATVSKYSVFTA